MTPQANSDRTSSAWRRALGPPVAALLLLACLGQQTAARADNWTMRDYGDFSPAEAHKAQSYLKVAMTEPMDKAAAEAAQIRAPEMLHYGLGLALGRDPATNAVDSDAKAQVQKLFLTAISVYQKDLGGDASVGYDPRVLNSADFWIWMARMLSMTPRNSIDVASTAAAAASIGPPSGLGDSVPTQVTGTLVEENGDFEGPDGNAYSLNGDLPILEPRVVSAAHACADYAYTAARMKRVAALDPQALPSVPPEKMRDLQQQAQQLFEQASQRGPGPCGGADFFAQVEAYAEGHLGKLATFKLAGQAQHPAPATPSSATP